LRCTSGRREPIKKSSFRGQNNGQKGWRPLKKNSGHHPHKSLPANRKNVRGKTFWRNLWQGIKKRRAADRKTLPPGETMGWGKKILKHEGGRGKLVRTERKMPFKRGKKRVGEREALKLRSEEFV